MSKTHLGHYIGPAPTDAELGIASAQVKLTPELICREAQRRSFAFGNVSLSSPAVMRELVDRIADETQREP